MEKRVLIATALAFMVLLLYPAFLNKLGVQPRQPQPTQQSQAKYESIVDDTVVKTDTVVETVIDTHDIVNDTVFENRAIKISINRATGIIKEVFVKGKNDDIPLYSLQGKGLGLFMPTVSTVSFEPQASGTKGEMVINSNEIQRRYRLDNEILHITLVSENEIGFYVSSKPDVSYREARYSRFLVMSDSGELLNLKPASLVKKAELINNVDWIAISHRYYSIIIDPQESVELDIQPSNAGKGIAVNIKGNSVGLDIKTFIGANSVALLSKYGRNWNSLLDYGVLNNVVKKGLELFFNLTRNYGLAIILLALLFNILFTPLTSKSFRSMKQMQLLQPEMQALKEQYKDNPQALNKEMLLLYKKHRVNPMGGCLPMLLQLPVFIALYNTLMRSYELKNAGFLWVKDLAEPDRLIMLAKSFPIIGNEINLLPLLMAALMFLQQKQSPASKAAGPSLMFMPVIFGFIFYKFPAGLVLYWFTNSLYMLVLQRFRK